jgi:hypothetical protein
MSLSTGSPDRFRSGFSKTITDNRWAHEIRYGYTWANGANEFIQSIQENLKFLKNPKADLKQFFHLNKLTAHAEATRKICRKFVTKIIENENVFDSLSIGRQAQALLFSSWEDLSPKTKGRLTSKFGEPLVDEKIKIIPTIEMHQTELESCGEMEARMIDSRIRVKIGERLLLKMHGTDAMISDKMIITKAGNVILPFVWYYPDTYFLQELEKRHQNIPEEGSEIAMQHIMDDFPLIGLQVVRNSPGASGEEGWDEPKHKDIFYNLRDSDNRLTSLFDQIK